MQSASINSILAHLGIIGANELALASLWDDVPHGSLPLFVEIAASLKNGAEMKHLHLLCDSEELVRLDRSTRPPFRSMEEVKLCHDRLTAKRIRMDWNDPECDAFDLLELCFPPPTIPGTATIRPIETPAMLLAEARAMHHCAAIYAKRVAACRTYLYKVLAPERATLSIIPNYHCWQIEQLFGACNEPVTPETRNAVQSWLFDAQFDGEPGVC